MRRLRSSQAILLVNLVDQLHHDIRASLHGLVIGTFDVDLGFTLLDAEMRTLGWWRWRWHHHALTRPTVSWTTIFWTPMAGWWWRRRIGSRASTWRRRWGRRRISLLTGIRRTWGRWRWLLGKRRTCREKKCGTGNNQLFHEGDLWCLTTQDKRPRKALGCSVPKIKFEVLSVLSEILPHSLRGIGTWAWRKDDSAVAVDEGAVVDVGVDGAGQHLAFDIAT